MKKFLAALVLVAGLSAAPVAAVHADPIDDLPSCSLGVNPNAPLLIPVSFACQQITLPNGTVLNAFAINQ